MGEFKPPKFAPATLERALLRSGVTVTKLAHLLGMQRVQVSRWVNGRAAPRYVAWIAALAILDYYARKTKGDHGKIEQNQGAFV